MIVGFLAGLVYVYGITKTINYHVDESWDDFKAAGYEHTAARMWWQVLTACVWPAYWVGRALVAPLDRLMLPPGDGV